MKLARFAVAIASLTLSGCMTYTPWFPCPAEGPAYELTDHLMETFNAGDAPWYVGKYPAGWHHSAWTDRRVVTCGSAKAHMRALGAHYRADGSEISRIDVPYSFVREETGWRFVGHPSGALPLP